MAEKGQMEKMEEAQELYFQKTANEAYHSALQKESPEESIQIILEYLGRVLQGERTYVFEHNECGNDDNTYEWVAEGVQPAKDMLQNLPGEVCAQWYQKFSADKNILIQDLEDIRETDPLQYENLKRQDIHSLVVVPLYDEYEVIGFYGVDNPSDRHLEQISELLQFCSDIIVSFLKRRSLIEQLRQEERSRSEAEWQLSMAKLEKMMLARTQENLDMINDIIGSGMWYMDFNMEGEMTSVFWSSTFRQMLGFQDTTDFPNELDSWSGRLHPEDAERTMEAYWDCVAGKKEYDVKYRLKKKNGVYDWFEAHGRTARYENGKPRLFIGTFINITDELKVQQAMEEAYQAANRANAAKTEFLASMSHDIRTPLNAVIGTTAIALANLHNPEKMQHCLTRIMDSSEHLLALVNEILDMNKIECGKFDLDMEEFNLADMIRGFISDFKPLALERQHRITVNMDGIIHEEVIGDSERLYRCLINFMGNAIKYTPDGGNICFSVSEKPAHRPAIGCYEFIFEDDGIGMSEEYIKTLFEPFSRADDKRAQKQQGTGLGMPITRNIIRMMNGDVKVESRLNEGSKFTATVFLKLQRESEAAPEPEVAACAQDLEEADFAGKPLDEYREQDFSGKRILVVEDNDINAEIATEILQMTGAVIDHVWNGQEAVDTLAAVPDGYYDLVFMDIQMPVMNGYEASAAIRRADSEYLRCVPIVTMSANTFAEDVKMSLSSGMNDHIAKPLEFDRLLGVLNEYL